MKINLKRLALVAMLLTGSQIAKGDQTGLSVGDLPGYGETAYFHEDATYAAGAVVPSSFVGDNHVGDSHVGDLPASASNPLIADAVPSVVTDANHSTLSTAPQPLNPALPAKPVKSVIRKSGSGDCDPACDSSASARAAANSLMGRMNKRLAAGDYWMSSDALLWFTPNRSMPALITTSDPQTLPALRDNAPGNVQTVFGDEINGEASGGIRLEFGKQVSEDFSIAGRFWWLGNNDDSYSASDDGSNMSIGRPFFNLLIPEQDAYLIASEPGPDVSVDFTGSIAARNQLSLWAAEAYGQLSLAKVDNAAFDLIGGYSHFSVSDMLWIQSEAIREDTARIRRLTDTFDIENQFNGGQIGFRLAMNHDRWSVSTLTKIHLGNMNQQISISGSDSDQTPPAAAAVDSDGFLAMEHTGEYERDTFSFVPEVNFKLGYAVRDNVNLTLGYSFLYFDNVALTGDVVNTNIYPLSIHDTDDLFAGNRPSFNFNDSGLWIQGIDFGMTIDF